MHLEQIRRMINNGKLIETEKRKTSTTIKKKKKKTPQHTGKFFFWVVGVERSSRKLDNLATLSMLRYHRNTFLLNKVRKRSKGKSKQKGWCREAKQRRNPSPLSHIFYQEKNRNKRTKKSLSKSSPRSSKTSLL